MFGGGVALGFVVFSRRAVEVRLRDLRVRAVYPDDVGGAPAADVRDGLTIASLNTMQDGRVS